MSAQERYLEALIELEDLRIAAEQEQRRAALNETSAGFKMALIAGMHSAIVRHFLHDDGGDAMRRVIHELNRIIRDHLERVEIAGYSLRPDRPGDLSVRIHWPKMDYSFNIVSPEGRLPEKLEEQSRRMHTHVVNEYTAPPIPPRMTEREEYEAIMRRKRGAG